MKIIERLKELREKATPGPWSVGLNTIGPDVVVESNEYTGPVSDDDAHLIVAAVNALPALLEVVEASRDYRDAVIRRDSDQAEWGAAGYTISQDELMRRSDRMDAAHAKLSEIKP